MGHQLPINDGVFQVISPSVAPRQVGGWALTTAMSALFATVMAGEPDGSVLRLRDGENAAPHREMENDIYNYIYTGFIRVYNSILGFIRFYYGTLSH